MRSTGTLPESARKVLEEILVWEWGRSYKSHVMVISIVNLRGFEISEEKTVSRVARRRVSKPTTTVASFLQQSHTYFKKPHLLIVT